LGAGLRVDVRVNNNNNGRVVGLAREAATGGGQAAYWDVRLD